MREQTQSHSARSRRSLPFLSGLLFAISLTTSTALPSPVRSWTSNDGRTMQARLAGQNGSRFVFAKSGRYYQVSPSRLSPESREKARRLMERMDQEPSQPNEIAPRSNSIAPRLDRHGLPLYGFFERVRLVRTTAYTHTEADHLAYGNRNAIGTPLKFTSTVRSAAADWSRYPVGTTFRIEGQPYLFEIDDYGSALVGTGTIDLYQPTHASMNRWGCRQLEIEIVKWGSLERSARILASRTHASHCRRMLHDIRHHLANHSRNDSANLASTNPTTPSTWSFSDGRSISSRLAGWNGTHLLLEGDGGLTHVSPHLLSPRACLLAWKALDLAEPLLPCHARGITLSDQETKAALLLCTHNEGALTLPPAISGPIKIRDKQASAPVDAPSTIRVAIAAANRLRNKPYRWGGGHRRIEDSGYDCSGSVSYALIKAGLLRSPLTSRGFLRYGKSGRGRWITIYAKNGHVFMTICGLRFDTGGHNGRGESGPRWRTGSRSTAGFTMRHPPGF